MALLINIDVPDAEGRRALLHQGFRPDGRPPLRQGFRRAAGLGGAGRHWTPFHLDVVVAEVDAAIACAVAAGAKVEAPARDTHYGRIAMLADPFGHGFRLLQFSARGYDALLEG
jgi:hypothetical protein